MQNWLILTCLIVVHSQGFAQDSTSPHPAFRFNVRPYGTSDSIRTFRLSTADREEIICEAYLPRKETEVTCPSLLPGDYKWDVMDSQGGVIIAAGLVVLPLEKEDGIITQIKWKSQEDGQEVYGVNHYDGVGTRSSTGITKDTSILVNHDYEKTTVVIFEQSTPGSWTPLRKVQSNQLAKLNLNRPIRIEPDTLPPKKPLAKPMPKAIPEMDLASLALYLKLTMESSKISREENYDVDATPVLGMGASLFVTTKDALVGQLLVDGHQTNTEYERGGVNPPSDQQKRLYVAGSLGWDISSLVGLGTNHVLSLGPAFSLQRMPISSDNQIDIAGGVDISYFWQTSWLLLKNRIHSLSGPNFSYQLSLAPGKEEPLAWWSSLTYRSSTAENSGAKAKFTEFGVLFGVRLLFQQH